MKIEALAFIKTDKKEPRLAIVNRGFFVQHLRDLYELLKDRKQGAKVVLTIEVWRDKRSVEANSKMHAWFNEIAKYSGMEMEDVKYFLKDKYLKTARLNSLGDPFVDPETGEVAYTVLNTRDLDTKACDEFMEKIRVWAMEYLGLYLDDK